MSPEHKEYLLRFQHEKTQAFENQKFLDEIEYPANVLLGRRSTTTVESNDGSARYDPLSLELQIERCFLARICETDFERGAFGSRLDDRVPLPLSQIFLEYLRTVSIDVRERERATVQSATPRYISLPGEDGSENIFRMCVPSLSPSPNDEQTERQSHVCREVCMLLAEKKGWRKAVESMIRLDALAVAGLLEAPYALSVELWSVHAANPNAIANKGKTALAYAQKVRSITNAITKHANAGKRALKTKNIKDRKQERVMSSRRSPVLGTPSIMTTTTATAVPTVITTTTTAMTPKASSVTTLARPSALKHRSADVKQRNHRRAPRNVHKSVSRITFGCFLPPFSSQL